MWQFLTAAVAEVFVERFQSQGGLFEFQHEIYNILPISSDAKQAAVNY